MYVYGGGVLLYVCKSVCRPEVCVGSPELGLEQVMRCPHGCWELNSSTLEEKYMFLTTALSLSPSLNYFSLVRVFYLSNSNETRAMTFYFLVFTLALKEDNVFWVTLNTGTFVYILAIKNALFKFKCSPCCLEFSFWFIWLTYLMRLKEVSDTLLTHNNAWVNK